MKNSMKRVELIPIFEDNYVFVIIDESNHSAVVVDPGEAAAVIEFLERSQLSLKAILLTHHHSDHIGGLTELLEFQAAPVYAPLKNKNSIRNANYVQQGDVLDLESFHFQVISLPGHTRGHVAYWSPDRKWLFSGDVLFGLGCGRLFEGTYEEAFESLNKIKALPPETLVYCAHEYTEENLNFCKLLTRLDNSPITGDDEDLVLYENELLGKRELNLPSVPLKLGIEMKVNPFLLAKDVEQFRYLRDLRNKQ